MRINVRHLNLRTPERVDRWIEDEILALGDARRIDEANVRLECRNETSPPFLVRIHLITPGPDVLAECRDHTLRAAFRKAIEQLRETVAGRVAKRRGNPRNVRAGLVPHLRGARSARS